MAVSNVFDTRALVESIVNVTERLRKVTTCFSRESKYNFRKDLRKDGPATDRVAMRNGPDRRRATGDDRVAMRKLSSFRFAGDSTQLFWHISHLAPPRRR